MMNIFFGCFLLMIVALLIVLAVKFGDGKSGHYLIEVRLLGTAALLLIMAVGFLTTDKPFCDLMPWFCE